MRRALAIWAVLGVELAACGHYGPPAGSEPADAGTEAPLSQPEASGSPARSEAEPNEERTGLPSDDKDDRDEP